MNWWWLQENTIKRTSTLRGRRRWLEMSWTGDRMLPHKDCCRNKDKTKSLQPQQQLCEAGIAILIARKTKTLKKHQSAQRPQMSEPKCMIIYPSVRDTSLWTTNSNSWWLWGNIRRSPNVLWTRNICIKIYQAEVQILQWIFDLLVALDRRSSHEDSSSGHHEYLSQISWQCI